MLARRLMAWSLQESLFATQLLTALLGSLIPVVCSHLTHSSSTRSSYDITPGLFSSMFAYTSGAFNHLREKFLHRHVPKSVFSPFFSIYTNHLHVHTFRALSASVR